MVWKGGEGGMMYAGVGSLKRDASSSRSLVSPALCIFWVAGRGDGRRKTRKAVRIRRGVWAKRGLMRQYTPADLRVFAIADGQIRLEKS